MPVIFREKLLNEISLQKELPTWINMKCLGCVLIWILSKECQAQHSAPVITHLVMTEYNVT